MARQQKAHVLTWAFLLARPSSQLGAACTVSGCRIGRVMLIPAFPAMMETARRESGPHAA